MDVPGGESKFQCCKEQHVIETWNVRSMSQGKLEVVKQEMATVNTIFGISELKWTRKCKDLNQVTIISAAVSKNLLEEME